MNEIVREHFVASVYEEPPEVLEFKASPLAVQSMHDIVDTVYPIYLNPDTPDLRPLPFIDERALNASKLRIVQHDLIHGLARAKRERGPVRLDGQLATAAAGYINMVGATQNRPIFDEYLAEVYVQKPRPVLPEYFVRPEDISGVLHPIQFRRAATRFTRHQRDLESWQRDGTWTDQQFHTAQTAASLGFRVAAEMVEIASGQGNR